MVKVCHNQLSVGSKSIVYHILSSLLFNYETNNLIIHLKYWYWLSILEFLKKTENNNNFIQTKPLFSFNYNKILIPLFFNNNNNNNNFIPTKP